MHSSRKPISQMSWSQTLQHPSHYIEHVDVTCRNSIYSDLGLSFDRCLSTMARPTAALGILSKRIGSCLLEGTR